MLHPSSSIKTENTLVVRPVPSAFFVLVLCMACMKAVFSFQGKNFIDENRGEPVYTNF